jgi:acid phosphatase
LRLDIKRERPALKPGKRNARSNAERHLKRALSVGLFGLCAALALAAPVAAADWSPDHIVIVIEENCSYDDMSNPKANVPYIRSLMRGDRAANFTNAHATDHPSQPNYLELFSGSSQETGSKYSADGSVPVVNGHALKGSNAPIGLTPLTTPNLAAALIASGRSFAIYSEDLPSIGFTGDHFGNPSKGQDYQRKHNPVVNWQAVTDGTLGPNQLKSTTNLPFAGHFPTVEADFAKLPTVSFVIPNELNDGHGSEGVKSDPLGQLDGWLQDHIDAYRRWAETHNSLLIITWDEDTKDSFTPVKDSQGNVVAQNFTNHIPTILAGAGITSGQYDEYVDHYSILRTIESMYGLKPLAERDAKAAVIAKAFRAAPKP